MTSRLIISTGTALGALVIATPVLAQNYTGPEMTYEGSGYEYAQPAPADFRQPAPTIAPPAAPITYRQEAVVQPLPPRAMQAQPVRYIKDRAGADYQVEQEYTPARRVTQAPQSYAPQAYAPQYSVPQQTVTGYTAQHSPRHAPRQSAQQQPVTYPSQYQQQPGFDREGWLNQCVDRVDGDGRGRRDRNGGVIGGLVGAAAGGLIGNRVAGRGDRLAGSLIGAGVGGLAGLAVGSAADRSANRSSDDAYAYCEDYLASYSAGGQYGYGYQQYGYQYAQPMMLVPVWVQVPQRAVVREYVTMETVEVDVVTYEEEPTRTRVIERTPAPQPTKPVYIKQSKPVRYIKGK